MKKRILISLKIVMVFVIAINATCCSSNKMVGLLDDGVVFCVGTYQLCVQPDICLTR